MNALSIWPAIVLTAIALAAAKVCTRWISLPPLVPGRLQALDGLRGFMAFFVFLHHSSIWYFYTRTGKWDYPDSNLYTHFGQSSVAIFFMITGFLFYSKILEARDRDIDWVRLYASRLLRLVPLYLFLMCILLVAGAYVSDFTIREPVTSLLFKCAQWITFNVLGTPDVNGVDKSFSMVAGVTWSLRYEWLFYLSLPVIALFCNVRTPSLLRVTAAVTVLGAALGVGLAHLKLIHVLTFLGGIAAAYIVRIPTLREKLQGHWAAIVGSMCLAAAVVAFRSTENPIDLLLLSAFFIVAACGNSFGGVLVSVPARILGEISYSIYLLHGMILFVVFQLMLGFDTAARLSPLAHWSVAAVCTPVLIFVSAATYKYVEAPPLTYTSHLTAIARSWLRRTRTLILTR